MTEREAMAESVCVQCGAALGADRCKLVCPRCGYFESCSDGGDLSPEPFRGPAGQTPGSPRGIRSA